MSADHPLRFALTNELHARPFADLATPAEVTHFAMLADEGDGQVERDHLEDLCTRYGVPRPARDATHFIETFGQVRLKWERHTEFTTYTFLWHGRPAAPFAEPVVTRVPADWLRALPGTRVVAAHVALLGDRMGNDGSAIDLERQFMADSLCRSAVLDGAAVIATDFRIHPDGFNRFLVQDRGLLPRQAGGIVQRLLELLTYRDMALLALPMAREASPVVRRIDSALAVLIGSMEGHGSVEDERAMLDRLIQVSAEIEQGIAATSYRFSAAQAYASLVGERLAELREARIDDYPTLGAFIDRRFAPAMRTCRSVETRQLALSQRATRAANLLRTRVDITLEGQNRDLLASMDRRARLQLRLQDTVEGLSVAAISYYMVSLLGYLLETARAAGAPVDVKLWQGIAVPLVALAVWWGARRVRRRMLDEEEPTPAR